MRIAALSMLALLAAADISFADGNFELPHSKEGINKCWGRAHERYGPNIQRVTQRTTADGTVVRFYVSLAGGDQWILTCHPASGKLVPWEYKKEN